MNRSGMSTSSVLATGFASLFVAVALVLAMQPAPQGWLMPVAATVAVVAAIADWRTHRIPNRLTGAGLVATVAIAVPVIASTDVTWSSLAIGAAVMAGPLLASNLLTRSHMPGLGDVKLAGVLGLSLGAVAPIAAFAALLATLVLGAAFGHLYQRRFGRRGFPLGPAIGFASVAVLLIAGLVGPVQG